MVPNSHKKISTAAVRIRAGGMAINNYDDKKKKQEDCLRTGKGEISVKKTIILSLVVIIMITLLVACGKKQNGPSGSVSLPSQIDRVTISWNASPRTTFSYTDPAKIKSMIEYLSSLVLEATEKDPTIYDGGGWVITVRYGGETLEMQHYGNMFFQTAEGKWWELSYDQAAGFDDLLKCTLPDEMSENLLFEEWSIN
jgi:hypothetical protein